MRWTAIAASGAELVTVALRRVDAAARGSLVDVLSDAGRVVRPDADAIAAALRDALATGHDQSAVHLALSRFTVEVQTRRILEIYREVLAARAA